MRRNQLNQPLAAVVLGLLLAAPSFAQDQNQSNQGNSRRGSQTASDTQDRNAGNTARQSARVASGQKQKIKGVIVRRDADNLVLRDASGVDTTIALTNSTKVEEKKSNPFRRAKNYATTQLLRGLNIEVEGRGDNSGALVADKIKLSEGDLMVARTVESRVTPVEGRVGEAETRLSQAEQNAQRLSGQIEELNAISNAARGGAKAAQETADTAIAGVNATNQRISTLVSGLDEYEAKKTATVNFKVGSAVLSPEAKATLDEVANQAKTEKAFVIEVSGFASSDGNEDLNRRLSQRRADAVVRYLAENHLIPLRRIITPFGYGESQPIADNSTRSGREQNRRVEVKILANRGLTTDRPASITRPANSSTDGTPGSQRPRVSNDTTRNP